MGSLTIRSVLRHPIAAARRIVGEPQYLVKIAISIVTLVLLVATMGYLITVQTSTLIATESREELEQSSLVQAQQLDTWLVNIEQEISRIAGSDTVQGGNTTAINRYLDLEISSVPRSVVAIHYVEFANGNATILATSEHGITGTTLAPETTPWVDSSPPLTTGTMTISDPYERSLGGQVIAFLKPVDGNTDRAVVFVVNPETTALGLQAPTGGQTFTINGQGTIVISTNSETIGDNAFERGYLTRSSFKRAKNVPSGVFATTYTENISYDGDRQLTAMTRMSTQDWLTITQTSSDVAFRVRTEVRNLLLVLVGGVLLIAVGIVGALGYTASRDISTLSAKAREVEQGNYNVELETDRGDEIGDAYRSVESMRDTLAEQIRESTLVEHSYDLITVIEPDGTITYQSPSAKHILGLDPEDLDGQNLTEQIHEGDTRAVRSALEQVAENPHIEQRFEFRIRNADGEWRVFQGVCENLLDNPFVEGFIVSSRDITERKERERELEETKRELERSNERLQEFAYVASHDLQEPLRMVSSFLDLLAQEYEDELDEEAQEYIEFAVDGATRMRAMIDALLEYSRVHTRGEEFTPVDSEAVLEETLQDLRMLIEEHDATVTHDSLPTVEADHEQLGQVFQNLIKNAIKHAGDAPPEVHVSASTTDSDDAYVFAVEDNGVGIPPDQQERVFEIFERGEQTDAESGTGIGLAVCKRIVERHGGDIWVDSEVGTGTTFYFTIPNTQMSIPDSDTE